MLSIGGEKSVLYNQQHTIGASPLSQTLKTEKNNTVMGKDDFLKLLVTQLRYQDPMKPMEDKEFIAQMAQFSSLEQMQNMAEGFMELKEAQMKMLHENYVAQAVSFIGKEVEALTMQRDGQGKTIYDEEGRAFTELVQGEVRGVKFEQGQPVLQVQFVKGEQSVTRAVRLEEVSKVMTKKEPVEVPTLPKEMGEEAMKDHG
ncbi:flagellar hook assembly protein FlgD [Heliorestis convoluta]|uniref:Basal-body rod modification protein FlgD n=1 Tax=Heliorestis convoluta TaxID=356322 RepID=A0A5Q2MYY5_9FIRM|nr:flagellar hook capping FlgD N-terminal domain-containing protein [Heliorestis convoluta]QGG48174.1 flagellar hook capping - N-terminal region family protein [Heliorestis convoluta]